MTAVRFRIAAVADRTLGKESIIIIARILFEVLTENILMSCRIPPSHQSGAKECSLHIKIKILTWTEKYCSNWVGTATVTSSKSDTSRDIKDSVFNIVFNVAILPIARGEKGLFSMCPSGTSCLSSA